MQIKQFIVVVVFLLLFFFCILGNIFKGESFSHPFSNPYI